MTKQPKAPHLSGNNFSVSAVPLLSPHDQDELIINFLRCEEFFETAIANLSVGAVFGDTEFEIITQAIHSVYESQALTPKEHGFQKAVRTEIRKIRDSFQGEEYEHYKEVAENTLSKGGLFRRAFAAKDHKIDFQHAKTLLGRLLFERAFWPLRELMKHFQAGKGMPEHLRAILETTLARIEDATAFQEKPVLSFADEWAEHNERLKPFRGKKRIGLTTGLQELDDRMVGLRGVTILAAKPGAGKTTYTLQVAVGVCEHVADNDCVVVFLSLDMSRFDMFRRVHCLLADTDWKTLMFGSSEELQEPCSSFSPQDKLKLKNAEKRFHKKGVGKRMVVLDREFLGERITPERLRAVIRTVKEKAGVKRALLIVDYLQLIPVPDEVSGRSEVAADKHRVRVIQQVLEGSQTSENPLGDTALVISEARKPSSSKDIWGDSLSDLMGSARLGYAADAVLLYREMGKKDVGKYYGILNEADIDAKRNALLGKGIVPIMLILEKGRDGMSRGKWPQEFLIWKSQFRPLNTKSLGDKVLPSSAGDETPENGTSPASGKSVTVPKLPPGSLAPKSKKTVHKSAKPKAK